MKIGIGLSQDPDPAKAAVQAAQDARRGVPKPDLAIAFGSIYHDQKRLHDALVREIDPDILMGGSSYAEITPAGVTKHSVAVLFLSLDGIDLNLARVDGSKDLKKIGASLGRAVKKAPRGRDRLTLGLLLSGLSTGRENELLRHLSSVLGPTPIFGGMPSGNHDLGMSHPDFWKTYQYLGPRLRSNASHLAFLSMPSRDFCVAFGSEHGWEPVGPLVTLTRCKGNKVFEVDGQPVLDYYRQFLGRDHPDSFFELMIQRYAFSLCQCEDGQRTLLKLPVSCDLKGKSISYFPAEDMQGRKVQLIQSNRKALVEGARTAAKRCRESLSGMDPALVLMVSCCTRNAILHSNMDLEARAVREVFGRDVPVFGFYSGGEFAPLLSRYDEATDPNHVAAGSYYHTTTVGILAIGSRKPARVSFPSTAKNPPTPGDAAEIELLRAQLAKSEEILDHTEGFLSNLNRKSYQDGERLRRQNEVIHRYTPHNVWEQVGANAARGVYELPDAEFWGCFLFMDVKGFTSYSEDRQPREVVAALNVIFEPATEIIYRNGGDVDKYIGDCIFAAFAEPEGALRAGAELLRLFRRMKERNSPFTVRVGLHYGRAVRANVGSESRREYTYIGDAVNTAQRLESNCATGKLLISEELFKKAKAAFPEAVRREVSVKGKKKSIVAYECGLSDRPSKAE